MCNCQYYNNQNEKKQKKLVYIKCYNYKEKRFYINNCPKKKRKTSIYYDDFYNNDRGQQVCNPNIY